MTHQLLAITGWLQEGPGTFINTFVGLWGTPKSKPYNDLITFHSWFCPLSFPLSLQLAWWSWQTGSWWVPQGQETLSCRAVASPSPCCSAPRLPVEGGGGRKGRDRDGVKKRGHFTQYYWSHYSTIQCLKSTHHITHHITSLCMRMQDCRNSHNVVP